MTEAAAFELAAIGLAAGFALLAPTWARPLHGRGMRLLGKLAARPWLAVLMLGLGTAALAALCAFVVHWPQPSIHDEFAYLLGAETFAGGELTRPTHPFWEHFETFHILQHPTYAPKYPPGQSLALAAGMVVFGEIRAGLWLEAGAMVAALTWMLFQWVPRRWALLGGVLIALHLGVRGPWVQTFYGGALAATGGALMLGAIPGIVQRRSIGAALTLGFGLALMALSRPFEGMMASLPVAVFLGYHWIRSPRGQRLTFASRVALPIAIVLSGLVLWIGLHNRAVTGDATQLPYAAYDEQYSVYPPFLWQEPRPEPAYRHAAIRRFMTTFQRGSHGMTGVQSHIELALIRQWHLLRGLLGTPLALLLLASSVALAWGPVRRALPARHHRSLALPLAVVAAVGLASSVTTFAAPRYAGPALGALLILLMVVWRRVLIAPRKMRPRGSAIAIAATMALVAVTAERGSKRWLGGERYLGRIRAGIVAKLAQEPGRDLVLVHASEASPMHDEFVFNAADIDAAPIVWARDLGEAKNAALMGHFRDRKVWRLRLDSLMEGRWSLEPSQVAPEPSSAPPPSPPVSEALPWGSW